MNQVRAFSDTEIVTIAAVAASALGGIVIGLGRGQESSPASHSERSLALAALDRARTSGSSIVPPIPRREVSVDSDTVRETIHAVKRKSTSAARRAVPNLEAGSALSEARRRVTGGRPSSRSNVTSHLKTLGKQILDTGLSSSTNLDLQALRSGGLGMLSQLVERNTSDAEPDAGNSTGLRAKVAESLEGLEVGSAPEVMNAAKTRSKAIARERVATPVAHTVGATSDVAKDSAAAFVWLGLGTAVVYFGLLSADRREQVKAALCGAIEQTRLLMLDLQGYEPEM